jgi:hypothetical protein
MNSLTRTPHGELARQGKGRSFSSNQTSRVAIMGSSIAEP